MQRIFMLFTLFLALSVLSGLYSPVAVADEPKIRFVTENFPPYNYQNNAGQLIGASAEIVKALIAQLNLDSKIEIMPWARAYKVASTEANVLIFSILRTEEREEQFHWLSDISGIDMQLFALPNAEKQPFDDINSQTDKTFGVVHNSSQHAFIKGHKAIPAQHIIEGTSYEQLYQMQQLNRFDLFMAPSLLVDYLNNKFNTPLNKRPVPVFIVPESEKCKLYLAFSKQTSPATVKRFRQALQQLNRSGYIAEVVNNYKMQLAYYRQ